VSENRFVRVEVGDFPNARRLRDDFWSPYRRGIVVCGVCERRCHIPDGYTGICGNYANSGGVLYDIGYGQLSAVESRPIEIKPLFHFHPNSTALTFSGWGCNFHCRWCQNYHLSMVKPLEPPNRIVRPEELVKMALRYGDQGLCASFNEPTIHLQYLLDVFEAGHREGLYNTILSNGYMTIKSLRALVDAHLDGLNIDIKGCPKAHRVEVRGVKPEIIYRNARMLLDMGVHVEMVLLVVTCFNDDPSCLEWIVRMHADILGPDIPLHINRYYPAYRYDAPPTPIETLLEAYSLAKKHGIKFVYIGNIGDSRYETTYCPRCGYPLLIRGGYRVLESRLDGDRCRRCGEKIYLTGRVYA
jgi:pyruvate formate lyase activating enzyme